MASQDPEHLDPSDLGTHSYWEHCYSEELKNHSENPDDEGTVWFSDSFAEEKTIEFLESLAEENAICKTLSHSGTSNGSATTFLDVGTGNGHFLFQLRDYGWEGNMLGIDYSAASIRLAEQIQDTRQCGIASDHSEEMTPCSPHRVAFLELDILSEESLGDIRPFGVVLDKGTFDAISLSGETDAAGRRIVQNYRPQVKRLIRHNGFLLITSCNWTEDELRSQFEGNYDLEPGELVFWDRVKYPSFTFGGQQGQSVVTLCFKYYEQQVEG